MLPPRRRPIASATTSRVDTEELGGVLTEKLTELFAESATEFRTEPKMQMVISCQRPPDMWNLTGRVCRREFD